MLGQEDGQQLAGQLCAITVFSFSPPPNANPLELTASIQNERKCLVCLHALEPLGGWREGGEGLASSLPVGAAQA